MIVTVAELPISSYQVTCNSKNCKVKSKYRARSHFKKKKKGFNKTIDIVSIEKLPCGIFKKFLSFRFRKVEILKSLSLRLKELKRFQISTEGLKTVQGTILDSAQEGNDFGFLAIPYLILQNQI